MRNEFGFLSRALTLALLAAPLAPGAPAVAVEASGTGVPATTRSLIRSDTFNLAGALQKVAHDFWNPPRGTLLEIEKLHDFQSFTEGAEIEKYEVRDKDGKSYGSFVRVRCYPGGDSIIDLAVRFQDGKIVNAEPIRPVILSGAPFLRLPDLIDLLKGRKVGSYAAGFEKIFLGMVYLHDAAAGEDDPGLSREQEDLLLKAIEAMRPPLKVGTKMPSFAARDLAGKPVTNATLLGKPALVLVASVSHDMSQDVIEWTRRLAAEPGFDSYLCRVFADAQTTIDQFRNRGGDVSGMTIADSSRTLHDLFQIAYMPTLLVFDAAGTLKGSIRAPWTGLPDLRKAIDALKK